MERGVSAAGEGFPSHQFPSIVHQGGAIEVSGLFRSSSRRPALVRPFKT